VDPRLATLQREISSAVSGLSPEQLRRTMPGKWSTAEILEHLYLTYTGTVKGFERVIAADKPLASPANWKQRGRAFVVVGLGHMPQGRKSPAVGLPRGIAPEKVVAEIAPTISAMDAIMSRCAAGFGARAKVLDHPVLGPLSVQQWRKFHVVHGMHHVRQIHRLREKLNRGEI
jgi:hypothetical protein